MFEVELIIPYWKLEALMTPCYDFFKDISGLSNMGLPKRVADWLHNLERNNLLEAIWSIST